MTDWVDPKTLSLEELARRKAGFNTYERADASAEMDRRAVKAQMDAARYMMWSVIAIAITSSLTAFTAVATWLWPNPLMH